MGLFTHWYFLLGLLILVLIIYGPGKLPEVGGAIGKAMREFRKASSDLTDEIRRSADTSSQPRPMDTPQAPQPPSSEASPVKPVDTTSPERHG